MTAFLLAGLGNPGSRYAGNRHNAGFMAVDAVAEDYGFPPFAQKFGGKLTEKTLQLSRALPCPHPLPKGEGTKILLFKPMDYMNNSGIALSELARFYKIPLENICVIHDELDLPPGKIRVKRGGGNGGHNGLKSIDAHLGADYLRLRIGIGHPGDKDLVTGYVLSDFTNEERRTLKPVLEAISDHIELLVSSDEAGFMSKVALDTRET